MLKTQTIKEPAARAAPRDTAEAGAPGSRAATLLALFALYVIWGSTYLGIRIALEGFPPFFMAGVRFLAAGGVMYVVLRARGAPNPSRAQWIGAGCVGALLLLLGNGLVVFAEQWVSSGLAAVGVATTPIWAAIFAGLWGQWPTRIEWAAVALGIAGVVLLNLENDMRANPVGAVAVLCATGFWAFGSVWSRHLSLPGGAMSSAAEMLVGGALLFAVSLGSGEHLAAPPSVRALGALVYLAVFGSIVAFSAYGYLLRHVRPAIATSYAYVNPVVAVALGAVLAGEHVSGLGLIAMAIILGAVVLMTLGRERH